MNDKFSILSDIIHTRRAIYPKNFDPLQEIDDALINALLHNALMAPTHKKTEPWRFVVIKQSAKDRLAEWMEADYRANQSNPISETGLEKFLEKPRLSKVVIALIMQRNEASGLPEWEEIAAVACAAQNLWLSASAAGLGTYWSSPSAITRIDSFIPLATHERCLGLFYLGYTQVPTESIPSNRTPIEQKVTWME